MRCTFMPIDNVSIGKKLKELRMGRELTQSQLAEVLHMNQQSISRYENGEAQISYTDMVNLSNYFGISSDYFFEMQTDEIKEDEVRLLAYYRAINEKLKPQALNLFKTLADEFPKEDKRLGER